MEELSQPSGTRVNIEKDRDLWQAEVEYMAVPPTDQRRRRSACARRAARREVQGRHGQEADYSQYMTSKGCRLLSRRQDSAMRGPRRQEARAERLMVNDFSLARTRRHRAGSVSGSLRVLDA